MKRKHIIALLCALLCGSANVMAQKYKLTGIEREQIVIDNRYADDAKGAEFLKPYKAKVDSVMSPVVGTSAKYMRSHAPESELSNLLSDIMVWGGKIYAETPDIGLYNLGGIRAALPAGVVTYGDILNIAPFENKICFLTLNGEQLTNLFRRLGKGHGTGVSKGLKVVYKNRELVSITYNGEPVTADKTYRIATIDYLIQGNDGYKELRNGSMLVSPRDAYANTRNIIADYFREKAAAGEQVDAQIEGRVVSE